jgi:hypothetical protein
VADRRTDLDHGQVQFLGNLIADSSLSFRKNRLRMGLKRTRLRFDNLKFLFNAQSKVFFLKSHGV